MTQNSRLIGLVNVHAQGAVEVLRKSIPPDGHAVSIVFESQESADRFHAALDEAMKIADVAPAVRLPVGLTDWNIRAAMMSAQALLPHSVLGHPARMLWIGKRFVAEIGVASGAAGKESTHA